MSDPAPGRAILSVQSLVKSFGAQPILDDVSMTVHEGDRIGLIGANGSGKSTLMKIMAGIETQDDSEVIDNIMTVYNAVLHSLPQEHNNIKNIQLKLTMGKPLTIE